MQVKRMGYKSLVVMKIMMWAVIVHALITSDQGCAHEMKAARSAIPTPSVPSLEYYVHVELGGPSIARLAGALNQNFSAEFGEVDVFNLNITSGRDPHASPPIGYVRGFTVQTSYSPGSTASRNVEVEVISYNDGFGLNGTISLQGLILLAPNEIAIVGGTGSFRGVRGYALIDMVANNMPVLLYHHSLFFL